MRQERNVDKHRHNPQQRVRKGIVDMTQLPSKDTPIDEAEIEKIKRLIEEAGKLTDNRYKRP